MDHPRVEALVQRRCSFPLTPGNSILVIGDGAKSLETMLSAIHEARQELLVQTYILSGGEVQEKLCSALVERSHQGVTVRFLIDPIGSFVLDSHVVARLREAGVVFDGFLRPNPFKGRFQLNFRNHRKLLIVDGQRAFTGGRNWSDPYFLDVGARGAYRDLTVEVCGPVVTALRRVFLEDWCIASNESLPELLSAFEFEPQPVGDVAARVLTCGPDEPNAAYHDVLSVALNRAEHSILIVSPYFVPGFQLLHALHLAASSGLSVRILVPERSDSRIADHAARYFARKLAPSGVEVLLRRDVFLHTKAIVVDNTWSTVGSANFDQRSFFLNYELNLEVVGSSFARDLCSVLETDLVDSIPFDPRDPTLRQRFFEGAAALFEPML